VVVVVEVVVGQRKEQQRSIDTRALSLAWLPRCARFAPLLLLLLLLLVVSGPPPPSCGASCWASLSLVGHRARVSNSITTTTTTTTISREKEREISLLVWMLVSGVRLERYLSLDHDGQRRDERSTATNQHGTLEWLGCRVDD